MIVIDGKKYHNAAIIGLCSSTGPESGKSYAARRIIQLCGTGSGDVLSYANPLKVVCAHLIKTVWGLDPDTVNKSDKLTETLTVRDLYIELGTKGFREKVDDDIWIYLMKQKLKQELERANGAVRFYVIDDVRFLNEFDFIVNCGGAVFNIRNVQKEGNPFTDAGDLVGDLFSGSRTLLNDPKGSLLLLEREILTKVRPLINIMIGE